MPGRDELIQGFQGLDARLDALSDAIIANPEAPLPEGEWRVRDALSHLAASSNPVPRVLERAGGGEGGGMPGNDEQVAERADVSAADLIAEVKAGHEASIAALADADDAVFAVEIPLGFRPGDIAVGDLLGMLVTSHESGHIDDIEAALA